MSKTFKKQIAGLLLAGGMALAVIEPAVAGAGGSAWMYTQSRTGPDCHGVSAKATYVDANWKWRGKLDKTYPLVDQYTSWYSDVNTTHKSGCGNGHGTASFIAQRI